MTMRQPGFILMLNRLTIILLMAAGPVVSVSASASESQATLGSKSMTVHQVKNVVGPAVQIDEQGLISAAWVEEEKETRTILFARSEQPGSPLGTPVRVNQLSESPYYRQESPALVVRGNDIFITWSLTHPKLTPEKPFS